MRLFRTKRGPVVEHDGSVRLIANVGWDDIFQAADPTGFLESAAQNGEETVLPAGSELLAPVSGQEVWAAGVTYYKSRDARMEESKEAGGGSFYDRVYDADRPELFFKATARNVVTNDQPVTIRDDSSWNVPEPELVLAISAGGAIFGYLAGNDMSSRDIEGENPLYLPQAKVYDGSCGLAAAITVLAEPPPAATAIELTITRDGNEAFAGTTTLEELKRGLEELAGWLYRHNRFPAGAFLMTGTGIVPTAEFTLEHGDLITISIEGIGTLSNPVA